MYTSYSRSESVDAIQKDAETADEIRNLLAQRRKLLHEKATSEEALRDVDGRLALVDRCITELHGKMTS